MFPVSGNYPGQPVTIQGIDGTKLWAGNLMVQGLSGPSGPEWLVFASQPIALSGPAGNSVRGVPPLGRIYGAMVQGTFVTGSTVVRAQIASGGLPDTISGLRGYNGYSALLGGNISGLPVPTSPFIGIQWTVEGASGIVNNSNIASVVSGLNIGVWLVGE